MNKEMRSAILIAALAGAACSGGEPAADAPRWVTLTSAPGTHRAERGDDAPRFEFPLPSASWKPGVAGQWVVPDPLAGSDLPNDLERGPRLVAGDRAFDYIAPENVGIRNFVERNPKPGEFYFFRDSLFVHLEPGEPVPDFVFSVPATLAALRGERPRAFTREVTGDGLSVRTGEAVELRADLPANAALRFETAVLSPFAAADPAPSRLVVEVDGRSVYEYDTVAARTFERERHEVPLPVDARPGATVRFRGEGADAVWAVFAPVIGPAEVGSFADRPWPEARPNLIVFLVDTLRADTLSDYGGTLDLSPNIDAFADEAVVFQRAWSPASWTLPAQASMFTATYPYQHGARRANSKLGTGLETLAERLRDAGYRTGAVTDAHFVSRRFGMDRGFEWYQEHIERTLAKTAASMREFLDADDGRPFFLYVQTYRVHGPYAASDDVRAAHGERLGLGATWEELIQSLQAHVLETFGEDESMRSPEGVFAFLRGRWTDHMFEVADALQRLYHGGILDMDRELADWLAELDARGLRGNTVTVFTSDHGEAFGEHEAIFHRDGVWEEVSRVPLMIRAPGLEPRRTARPATLIDLPRTLTALLGVEPGVHWLGTDLMAGDGENPVFYFDCADDQPRAAWIDGRYKVAFRTAGDQELQPTADFVYDLVEDPTEQNNMADELPDAVRDSLEERAADTRALMAPLDEAGAAALDDDTIRRLEAMGYTGDEG